MHLRGLSLGIVETFPIFKDRNSRQTKHKRHTQLLASKETNELVHKSGKRPTTFLSPTGYPTQKQNKLAYSGEKAPNREEIKFPAVHTGATHPTGWSLSAPKCRFLALTAKCWGSRCCLEELWREDPQDKWSWQVPGLPPKFPNWDQLATSSKAPGWPIKICYWAQACTACHTTGQ